MVVSCSLAVFFSKSTGYQNWEFSVNFGPRWSQPLLGEGCMFKGKLFNKGRHTVNKWVSGWLCHTLSYLPPMDCRDKLSSYPLKQSSNVISQMWFQLTLSTTRRGFNTLTTHILPITQRWPYFLKSSDIFQMTLDSIYWKISFSYPQKILLAFLHYLFQVYWSVWRSCDRGCRKNIIARNWKTKKRKPTFIFEK